MVRVKAFAWKRAAGLSKLDVDACERELSRLHRTSCLTAAAVVDVARDPESALHGGFTWDDGEAAEKWRLEEAGKIIRAVVVIEPTPDGGSKERRHFVNVKVVEDDEAPNICEKGIYVETTKALSVPKYRDQVLHQALRDAAAYADKYRDLEELSRIVRAIDATVKQYEREHAIA